MYVHVSYDYTVQGLYLPYRTPGQETPPFHPLLYVNIPGHKDIVQRTHFSLELHPALLPACSVRQPMVSNVSSHVGTRKGAIQRPTRGGGPHRPSAFPARGTRPSVARQRPPSRARRDPRPQHGPITRTYVQEARSGVRLPSPPPPLRIFDKASLPAEESTR